MEAVINETMAGAEDEADVVGDAVDPLDVNGNKSKEQNTPVGSIGDLLPVNELKDPIILGNSVLHGQNYFEMKA